MKQVIITSGDGRISLDMPGCDLTEAIGLVESARAVLRLKVLNAFSAAERKAAEDKTEEVKP